MEKAFETDLIFGCEIESRNQQGRGWEAGFVSDATYFSDVLCADILAYLWSGRPPLKSGVREEIVKAITSPVWLDRTPRSLDEVAHLARQITSGEARQQFAWTPNIEAGQVATLTWIEEEIRRDEFRVAWLAKDGLAQRTLRQWGRATHERIHRGSAERRALIKG